MPQPIGTNMLSPDTHLYDPKAGSRSGKVLEVGSFEFQDGTGTGVLVKAEHGAASWIPRENMGDVLVEVK